MFHSSIYQNRRKELMASIGPGIALIFGNKETPMNYPGNPYPFRQDSNFLYFFGVDQPGLVGILDADSGEEVILGNELDLDDIIWMGFHETIREKAHKAGIEKVTPAQELVTYINKAKENKRPIHFLPPYPHERRIKLAELLGVVPGAVEKEVSLPLIQAVAALRSRKIPEEIDQMEKTLSEVTHPMFVTAMRMADAGMTEFEIAGTLEGLALREDLRLAYPIICSVRGEVLHNHDHSNVLKSDQMLLVDAGSESPMHYATDITRTIPVNRRFAPRQKAVYEIVLQAQEAAINAIKPGVAFKDIHLLTCKVLTEGLKGLNLLKGNTDNIVEQGAHAMFLPHGLGHMIGLDVHDMEDLGEDNFAYTEEITRSAQFGTANLRLGRPLEEGYVVTVEPGLYFIPALVSQWKEKKMFAEYINYPEVEKFTGFGGVRIEDNILVTKDGYRILGKPIPKTVSEIESL
ncbi:MAG: aminopeptidase P family protein [Bacteroidota bacterium]